MGLYYLFGLCFAFLSFPALAADPPVPRGNVSVNLNPTTSYYSSTSSTFRLPNGVSISPVNTSVPVVTKYPAGLQQTIPTRITIDAIKKSAPLPAVVRSSTQSLKSAATRCLTSAKCNVGLLLAGAGINKLLDDLDWVMNEGSKIQKANVYGDVPDKVYSRAGCNEHHDNVGGTCGSFPITVGSTGSNTYFCEASYKGLPLTGASLKGGGWCYFGGTSSLGGGPVSDSDIAMGVDSKYTPEPSDWPALTPELKLDDVEITSAPTLQGEPIITTVYDAHGVPHEITETNIWYDFDIRDNGSSQPALDLKKREETKTYKDGALTGTTTTESTDTSGSGGGGGGAASKIDIL